MMMNRDDIYHLIEKERERQDTLHPDFTKDIHKAMVILVEEVGEVMKALNDDNLDNFRDELVQVASVAVRILEKMVIE